MNRLTLLVVLCLVSSQADLSAQEAAAGDQATTPVATTPAPPPAAPDMANPGQLAPPADNAPVAAPTVPATTTDATAPVTTTKPSSSSTVMTPSETRRIQEQEIIRRQELAYRANQSLVEAQKAELGKNYPEARKDYLFSAEALASISRSTTSYARAAEGLTRVDFALYDDALQMGDTARAKQLMDEVVTYNPNNKEANKRQLAIDHMLANPNDTSLLGNPAVTPGLVNKVNEIQDLFAQAEQFRRTGQWDQAEARLKRILGIDPYNIAATQQLERIDKEKNDYADAARIQTRDQMLRQVEEKWYEPIQNKEDSPSAQEEQPIISRTTNFDIDQELRGINVSLDFTNTSIEEATNYLSAQSKQLDPAHKGINFIIQPAASETAKPITLTLNNLPLEEALRYVCQLANVKYKVQDYAISIVPFTQNTDDLISRTFIVQPSFVVPPTASGTTLGAASAAFGEGRPLPPSIGGDAASGTGTDADGGDTVRQALEAKGVNFPPGASAVYTASNSQLTIVDTADQMELLEELVNAGQAPTLMVRIATKFVEINQNDLDDLTINSAFNFYTPQFFPHGQPADPRTGSVTNNPLTFSHFNTALAGSQGFSPNGLDTLLNPTTTQYNSLYFRSFLDGAQYNVVVDTLSQKKSFDLLSQPFATTKSGEQAVLEAVRQFPYPIAFDPPELLTQTSNNNNSNNNALALTPPVVIATTPTDFKRRNVGVRLVIKPQVAADNKNIDLSLFPEVTDFQGFINYGSPIYVGNPDGSQSLLSANEINQPVFNTRRINTKVLIRDGSTVVLGGLIREDLQHTEDKVPFLGDLPLIGRLFQSKAVENTKRNLIIFVSANIYRNDGELLNPPEDVNAAGILTGQAAFAPAPAGPQ